ncbi:tRNA pseudouridine(38-40) synthase TruA [Thermodesulfobacteriota bacterium]
MSKNFKLTIEYDGTNFHGWQRQKNECTIQAEIETAITTMTGQTVTLIGSGRTDAGVHAVGQVANFHCDTELSPEVFQKGLNSLVSADIIIKRCEAVPETFHSRFDAKSKTYHYNILNREIPSAIGRQYVWFIRKKLDHDLIRAAIGKIIGRHDFKAFEGAGSPRSSTTREVMKAELMEEEQGRCIFEVEADGFLRFMVRNLVGTLVEVGHGNITSEDFHNILLSKDRNLAGATAPAQGLFLMKVKYA